MTGGVRGRGVAVATALTGAVVILAAGCGNRDAVPSDPVPTVPASPSGQETSTSTTPAGTRDDDQLAYLAELTELGLPTGLSADTAVEVGVGICRKISDGADTATILENIRPLTGAIASQNPGYDEERVGRAFVDASRAHLCG